MKFGVSSLGKVCRGAPSRRGWCIRNVIDIGQLLDGSTRRVTGYARILKALHRRWSDLDLHGNQHPAILSESDSPRLISLAASAGKNVRE
jgi:hypothetical protein